MNTFGRIFRFTSFGESHGMSIGGVIDGVPSNVALDLDEIQYEVDRRKPGRCNLMSQRREEDKVVFVSGLKDNVTLGSPVAFFVINNDFKEKDYKNISDVFRPSHADFTYYKKYGILSDSGGGRASARETLVRVVVGAVAKQILKVKGVEIFAYTHSIGNVSCPCETDIFDLKKHLANDNILNCPFFEISEKMKEEIELARSAKDSVGGSVRCIIAGVPVGIGEPVYDKLSARLAYAMMSINAAKSFAIGYARDICVKRGSQVNDQMFKDDNGEIRFMSNNSAGIQGGISNGQDIYMDISFKPTPTIASKQKTINKFSENVDIECTGRHDPCVVPRAVPVVEAMAAIVLLDMYLIMKTNKL